MQAVQVTLGWLVSSDRANTHDELQKKYIWKVGDLLSDLTPSVRVIFDVAFDEGHVFDIYLLLRKQRYTGAHYNGCS